MRANGELRLELAIAQNLDRVRSAHKAVRAEQVRRHGFSCGEHVEFFEIDDRKRRTKRIVKSALRNAAVQRHLAALKSAAARIAAAGCVAVVGGGGRLCRPRNGS